MNLRRSIFFALDKIKGGHVCKHLEEIKKANNDKKYADKLQKEAISKLLAHVVSTVPYYKKRLKDKNSFKLEDFPIVSKVDIKNNMEDFLSKKNLKICKVRTTSGSTGIPFKIVQDKDKCDRIIAEIIYYREITGDKLGNKYINLVSVNKFVSESKFVNKKINVINFDVTNLTPKRMDKLYLLLKNDRKITYMLGYESALEQVANYFKEKKYDADNNLRAVVSSSEILSKEMFEKMKETFGCNVFDRYSNEDNGFIAQTNGKTQDFIVNRASYKVEILKLDKDELADKNEIGRIIVTDLFNYVQPFVRYDTGDLGAYDIKVIDGVEQYVLTHIYGRIQDNIYNNNNQNISSYAVGDMIWTSFEEVNQFQLIQNSKNEFELKLIEPKKMYTDSEYEAALKKLVGEDVNLTVTYVNEIPQLRSGKHRRVICKYKPIKE